MAEEVDEYTHSRFKRTVEALAQADSDGDRTDFARAAFTQLLEVYLAEADLARNEAHDRENNKKLLGWAKAVDQYANELILVLDDVDAGYPITFSAIGAGPVGVKVAGRYLLLSHPRANQQDAYERRVLELFCRQQRCSKLTEVEQVVEPIPVSAASIIPQWHFSTEGPVCFSERPDIRIQFHSTANLPRIRALCRQLFHELATLVHELKWQRRHGVELDWAGMELAPSPGRPEHLLTISAQGDVSLLSLPLLHGSADLFTQVLPIVSSEVLNTAEAEPLVLDSAQFGWESYQDTMKRSQ